jgi:hypothetical protein
MTESITERIKRLKEFSDRQSADLKKKTYQSGVGRAERDITSIQRFMLQLTLAFKWIWSAIIFPTVRWMKAPSLWVLHRYIRLWTYMVNVADPYGRMEFSKMRAGGMVIATFLMAFFVIPFTFVLTKDMLIYFQTVEIDEVVYLQSSQEVSVSRNIHNIEGCTKLNCGDKDALYFRVTNGLFNNLWSIVHGHGLFYPDYIAAVVPQGTSKCVITTYGIRTRLLVMNLDVFPEVLEIKSCTLVAGEKMLPEKEH